MGCFNIWQPTNGFLSSHQLSGGPFGRVHCVVETCKTLAAKEYLAKVFAPERLPGSTKWAVVVPRADTPTDTTKKAEFRAGIISK